ncbi:MAG TPA: efflux RND transporter permease subunit, partial [Geminicoccaceae bacterium]|nr:efflux RND transporter permease subunit [Geminicoccaceae bacterium]
MLVDGRQAVVVATQMTERERIGHWTAAVDAVLAGFRAELPAGIAVDVVFDQSRYTQERIDSLAGSLGLGVLLVALVLVVMMGWRSALLVASALPLTLLMVLAGFYWLGVPLHQISLTGLIIALGLLIDNVIISADSYQKHREQGMTPEAAVRATASTLFVPLGASTLTTVLTFLAIALLPGNAGAFVGSLGTGVILSLGCSLLLALTVVPAA